MISASRYHEIRCRAQTIFLKHYQIQNKAQHAHVKKGDEYLHPRDDFLSRYDPLNFIKMRRTDETRCFRIRYSIQATSTIRSPEWMCAKAINQLRQFLRNGLKKHYIRSEDGLFLRTGQKCCFETVKNGIREVACA